MEAETISRILNKLASSPSNTLNQDEILSCYRDRLISTCSEELRLIRQRASNLGKNDGKESRAAVVLQRIMETMMVTESDQKQISDNGNKRNHDLMRSQLVFDRKCIPTIKVLAGCIHVQPRSLEALKKSLQFYFSDSYNQTSNALFLTCPKDNKGNFTFNRNSEKIIQKLLIRLVSMLDFDYDAQRTVTSANKLYKEMAHFKLYGTQEAHRLRSATEYDMDKFIHYYCASCCFIILLGNFKQTVRNPIRRGKDKCNDEKVQGTAKKKKGGVKDYVKQIQNSIVQSEGLSLETFEDILQHVQSIILEIQKRNAISGTDEKKRRKSNVHDKRLPESSSSSDRSTLLTGLNSQTEQQTEKNYSDDGVTSKEPSTKGDGISEFDLICGKKESNGEHLLHGLDSFQQWKKRTLENYMSDIATETSHSGHLTTAEDNLPLDGKERERRLKKLAADKILRIHGYLHSN